MSATADLDAYIKSFRLRAELMQFYGSETVGTSIDTNELLSDNFKLNQYNKTNRNQSVRREKKKCCNRRHRGQSTETRGCRKQSVLKVANKTLINQFRPKYDINKFLPGDNKSPILFSKFLQNNQKEQRKISPYRTVQQVNSPSNYIDTELLLQSSDEERQNVTMPQKLVIPIPQSQRSNNSINPMQSITSRRNCKTPREVSLQSVGQFKVMAVRFIVKQICNALNCKERIGTYRQQGVLIKSPLKQRITICSCIAAGQLYKHYQNCRKFEVIASQSQQYLNIEDISLEVSGIIPDFDKENESMYCSIESIDTRQFNNTEKSLISSKGSQDRYGRRITPSDFMERIQIDRKLFQECNQELQTGTFGSKM